MIGSPENDAALRLECWRTAMEMAPDQRHNADAVDKMSTRIYSFIAGGGNAPPPESRDKSKQTPKR